MTAIKKFEFLFILIPILYIFSYTIADILLVTCCVVFLFNFFFYKQDYKFPYLYHLFSIYFIFLLTSIFSNHIEYSISKSIFFFRFIIFFYFIINLNSKLVKKFIVVNFISLILLSINIYYNLFSDLYHSFNFRNIFEYKHNSFFNKKELVVGGYLSKLIFLYSSFVILIYKKKIKPIYIYSFIVIISTSVFFTFNESSKIAIILSLLFLLFLILVSRKKYINIILLFSFFLIILLVYLKINFNPFIDFLKWSGYINKWYTSFLMFKDNPFFGIGIRNYRLECNLEIYQFVWYDLFGSFVNPCSTHPHNIYFEIISETGIIGFTIFIALLIRMLINKLSDIKKFKIEDLFIFLCLFVVFNPLTATSSFFSTNGSIIYWLVLGLFIKYKQDKKYE